ncbi:hypothetical protein MTO96_047988 [Rhipicephalus appendiculatus]
MSPTQLAAPNNALAPNGSAAPVRKMSSSWTDLRNVVGFTDGEAGVAALSNRTTPAMRTCGQSRRLPSTGSNQCSRRLMTGRTFVGVTNSFVQCSVS